MKAWSYHEYVQSELSFETKLDIDWWNYQMYFEELELKLCLWYVQCSCYCKMGYVEEDANL